MMNRIVASIVAVFVAAPAIADGHASGDPAAGEKVFAKCRACHMIESADGEEIQKGGKVGPNLWGIYQRQPGALEGFNYGDDLVAVGETMPDGWDEESFVAYAADPRAWLRATLDDNSAQSKMTFKLPKEEEARDVWAYLVSVGPEPEAAATN